MQSHAPSRLFDTPQSQEEKRKSETLMSVVDQLNNQMGQDTIRLGGQRKDAVWQLRRDYLTRRYTTEWGELPTVKIS